MSIVDIPGVGHVEFPDSMSDDEIAQTIKTKILKTPEPGTKEYEQAVLQKYAKADPAQYDTGSAAFQARVNPSSGGGTLRPLGIDTGINTPQAIDRLLSGSGRGMANVVRNVGNMAGLESDQAMRDAKATDAPLMKTKAGKVGDFIGNAAITALPTLATGGALGAAANSTRALAFLGNPITRGVAEGAVQGLISADDPSSRLSSTVAGGITGGVLPLAGTIVSKAARGLKRTPEAQQLLDDGVSLTPGQMNPKGVVNHIEEALQSVPVVGPSIKNARDNAAQDFQRAVIQRGSDVPISSDLTPTQALDEAYKGFAPLYDQVKNFPATKGTLAQDVTKAVGNPYVYADDAARNKVNGFVQNQISALRSPMLDTGDLIKLRSNIRDAARKAVRAQSDAEAELLDAAESQVTASLHAHLPADAQSTLARADRLYAQHKVAERALANATGREEGFTPTMLARAIKSSTSQGAFARGGGALRDLSDAGQQVLQVRNPATGARWGVLGPLAALGVAKPYVVIPAGSAAVLGATTQTGRKLAAGQYGAQRAVAGLLDRAQAATPQELRTLADLYSRGLLVSTATE